MRLPLPHRARLLPSVVALAVGATLAAVPVAGSAGAAPAPAAQVGDQVSGQVAARAGAPARQIDYTQWDGGKQFRSGTMRGLRFAQGAVLIKQPAGRRSYGGRSYDTATWTSPWTTPGMSFTQLITSWSAKTPGDSWIEVRVRGRNGAGTTSSWDVAGRWSSSDTYVKRHTDSRQDDDLARVDVDTWKTKSALKSYQLQVTLHRRAGTKAAPSLDTVGAMTSRLPGSAGTTSAPGVARGVVLDVPSYSQMTHRGHYPQWGNGGEAWCSPTSTSMVLGYYRSLPRSSEYSWIPRGHNEPWVDFAARNVYDHDYDGAGNWAFNTAYAAPRAGKAFVTRLRDLRDAERFIKAGIPLVASVAFDRGQLDGAPISASNGHLMVISGFTRSGDVVVNDPAASSNAGVRRTYSRSQFEKIWLEASGGLVYVIRDEAHPLPAGSPGAW